MFKYRQDLGIGRIAGSHMIYNYYTIFTGSQTGTSDYDWNPWESVLISKLCLVSLNNHFLLRKMLIR